MDFHYSEEQQMLADSLRRFVEAEYPFSRRREIARHGGAFDRGIWAALAEMGVLGLTVPADFGGFGEGPASQLVVHRELGRGLVSEPVIPSAVVGTAVHDGDGYRLDGVKSLVWHGDAADTYLVSARLPSPEGDLALFLVPRDAEGLHVTAIRPWTACAAPTCGCRA